MSSACIDNHILIWGIRKEATPGQEPMILRAEFFLKYLEGGLDNRGRAERGHWRVSGQGAGGKASGGSGGIGEAFPNRAL